MIKTALSLYIALFLAAGPVAAQVVESAGAGRAASGPAAAAGTNAAPLTGAGIALPVTSAGLTGGLSPAVAPVVAAIEAAALKPETLLSLKADPTPASVYARALIASSEAPIAPAARAEAVAALSETAVVRIEGAVKTMTAQAAAAPRAAAALKTVSAEFAGLVNRSPESLAVTAAAASKPAPLSAPKRAMRALKSAAFVATMAITMAVSPALHAQSLNQYLPVNPTQIMAQVGANQSQAEVLHARDINDAIAKWTPSTKLIIIGNPGLDQGEQNRLAAFLADKHWTIIVAENAQGMSFRDVDGNTRSGKEALEFGAGQGLFRKNGFSSQVDAASGLSDGSILVISMGEHYLFLRNSEAQRVNGLDGATNFSGDLDQWAKARLRAGGDIAGAVKETVVNIDARLNSSVASAAQSAKSTVADAKSAVDEFARARASFERSHGSVAGTVGAADLSALRAQIASADKALSAKNPSEAARLASAAANSARSATTAMSGYESNFTSGQTAITTAHADIDALEKASSSFLAKHPKATGDLARPDLRSLREKLKNAEASLAGNPAGAKSAAAAVTAEVVRVQTALNEHAAGADQIAASEAMLKQLESRGGADAASPDLVTAKQALREAREGHDLGASNWATQLQSAKSALANAERTITDAEAASRSAALMRLWMMIIAGLFTLGGSAFLNWRARKAKAVAEAELQKWDAILEKKLDTVIDELDKRMDVYVGPISGEKSRGWIDETAASAAQVRQDAGKAKLYLAMARNIHDRATALVRPKAMTAGWIANQFWPSRYLKAEAMLATEPLTFKPQDGFDDLFEKASDWRGDLYGEAKDYAPVSENFESVMAKFNAASKSAVSALDEIEKASTGYGAAFDATEAAIGSAEKKATAAAANAYFKVDALGTMILPAARETLAAARAKAAKNPVGAMKGQGALAERLASDSAALAELAASMYKNETSATDPVVAALTAASVGVKWIADSRAALDAQASKLASSLSKSEGAKGLEALKAAYSTHASNAVTAKTGLDAIQASQAAAVKSAASVDAARATVAAALNLAANDMLRETKNDPTQRLEGAADAFKDALAKLGKGALADAETAHQLGDSLVAQANAIVASSLKSLKDQEGDVSGRIAQAERLDALQAERAEILKTIKRDFAPSVLALNSGDASHPSSNGTVDDNIEEAQVAIDAAKSKRETAVRSFRAAKVLEAASLLSQAKAHEEIAQNRLDEISEKRARLDKAVADNNATLEKLEAKVRSWKTEIPDDSRSMRPTITAYAAASKDLVDARGLSDAKKGDPFKAAAAIAAVSTELDQVWVKVSNDRDAYAEVVRSLKAAESQLSAAASQANAASNDGVTDSPAITAAERDLANLNSAYKTAVAASQAAHGEWPTLDREADRITNEASHVAAILKGELAAAARATQAISSASSQVSQATNWTGSYGVSVPGSPGSGSISSARSALNSGDYEGAIRYAESARSAAIAAIQEAEAEVSRRRRAEEERQRQEEEARRRRQQEEDDRRRRSEEDSRRSSDSGSSGGGGSSWGGSSSGGGSSSW